MLVSSGKLAGRSHRDRDQPCQDAFAVRQGGGAGRLVAAVADGLGSRPLSHLGSDAATRAACATLAASNRWGPRAVHRAFRAARQELERVAAANGVGLDHVATTLQLVGLEHGRLLAGMVGDGAVLSASPAPHLLLGPGNSEYANEVVPLTDPTWQDHLRIATQLGVSNVFVFTDGLTRLLLVRRAGSWEPFGPFFEAMAPKLRARGFDPELVPRFLGSERIDQAWDDDKCLVVMAHGEPA